MFKISKKIIGFAVLIAIIGSGIFLFGGDKKLDSKIVSFEIKKGESVWEIGRNLKRDNLINSQLNFLFQSYKGGEQKKIKAGKYLISSKLTISEIVSLIIAGNVINENNQKKITFPEGWTNKQIAMRLEENGFDKEKFLEMTNEPDYFRDKYGYIFLDSIPAGKTLEGFLFPDTYFFANNSDVESIIKKMLDNFNKKLSSDLQKEIKRQDKTVYEIVTMASIIEREVKSNEDKKIVSGIFWRRISNGQALQSCATLAFILGENKKQYSYDDTKIESPYNTYLYPNLPPGPIANPGIDSILAAIYPTKTNYNYFLSNPETGKTIFSETLEEHNLNKAKNGL